MIRTGNERNWMMTNDDISKRELSREELEAIAASWPNWLDHAVNNFMVHHPLAATIIGGVVTVAVGVGYALLVTM
jgi:hypothetical protein